MKLKIDKHSLHSKIKITTKYSEIFKGWFQGRKDTFSKIFPMSSFAFVLFDGEISQYLFPENWILQSKDYNKNI
jgi:hypothetical protein